MKARLANLKVVIGFSKEGLRKLNKDIRDTKGKFRKNYGELANIARTTGAAIAGAISAGVVMAVKSGAKIQELEVGFRSIMGGADEAAAMVQKLNKFTAETPFRLEEVSQSARQLMAVGTRVEDVNDRLRMLGDIAAASGNSISDITAAFAKVQAKGKVELESLNQLAERGIPIFDELKKVTGDANMEFGAGAVSVEQYNQALANMASEGGFADDAMLNLSETVTGKLSTAMDNMEQAFAKFADRSGLMQVFSDMLDNTTAALQRSATGQEDVDAALAASGKLRERLTKVHKGNAAALSEEADAAVIAARKLNDILGTEESAAALATAVDVAGEAWGAYMESLKEASSIMADPAQVIIDQFNAYNDAGLESTRVSSLLTTKLKDSIVTAKEYKDAVSGLTTALGIEGMTGALQEVAMEEEELFDEGTAERIAFGTALLDRAKFAAENMGAAFSISSGLIGAAFDNIRDRSQGFHLYLKQMLTDLLKKALALAAAFAAMSILMSPAAMAKSVGSFKDFMMGGFGLGNIPKMASGGLFSGASLALVGEGPGTSLSNPEVVAPLDKLQQMMGGGHVTVTGMIRGSDILISNERATLDRNRVRGF